VTADNLLEDLKKRGVKLEVSPASGRLKVDAPKDAVTPELKAALQEHKAALMALLQPKRTPGDEGCPEHWQHIPALAPKGTVLTDSARYRVQLFNVWYIVHREPGISESHVSTVDTNSRRRMFADLHEFYRWAWAETHAHALTYRRMVN
jgi:hypothetical protein